MTNRVRKILLIAAGILVLGGALAMSVGPFSVGAVEARLTQSAENALSLRGHDWATVRFSGQHATLTGAAPSERARLDAIETVARSTWSGGRIAGGVTRVTDATVEARLQRGFIFRADVAVNGRVLIRGDATDANARQAITRYADANFPNGADTDLTLVPGGSRSPDWEEAAKRLLGQLARLERGAVVLQGDEAALVGDAANPQIAQSVSVALQTMPEPFRVAVLIAPSGAPVVRRIDDVNACAVIVQAAQGTESLRFDRSGPAPSPLTAVALRRVGRAFEACPADASLTVSVLREADEAGLDAARIEAVGALVTNGNSNPRIQVRLVQDQADAISFAISTLEE